MCLRCKFKACGQDITGKASQASTKARHVKAVKKKNIIQSKQELQTSTERCNIEDEPKSKTKGKGRETVQTRHIKSIPNNANNKQAQKQKQSNVNKQTTYPISRENKTLVVCGCETLSRTTSNVALLAQLVAQLDDVAGAVVEALLLHAAPELPVAIL
jgi:transketolase